VLFNSFAFVLLFLPATIFGFFASSRLSQHAGRLWLVAASLIFYGWWDVRFLPVLIASIAINHAFWRVIANTTARTQTLALIAGIGCNLCPLVYFKYAAAWLAAFGIAIPSPPLPLGISFSTFTQIGLLIDCRSGQAERPTLTGHSLFVSFFPHLIAGPILSHQEMMPQFAAEPVFRPSAVNIASGLTIFLIGLLKKTLLADPLASTVASGFAHADRLTLFPAWQTALSYSLQLYFDFSGYSDMAIGAARMLNIQFPANFNSPYKARSVIDYWQRWHITLTRYLTVYLYNPLALWLTRRRIACGRGIDRRARASWPGFANLVACPPPLL
jgi:alginate O-acetyltransferase complex protein AlgI